MSNHARVRDPVVVGLAGAYAWVLWVVLVTSLRQGDLLTAVGYVVGQLIAVGGVLLGRWWRNTGNERKVVAGLLGLAAFVLLSVTVRGGAGGGPLRYANANAALAIQLAALAAVIAAVSIKHRVRITAIATMALGLVAVPFTHSRAGTVFAGALAAVVIVVLVRRRRPANLRLVAATSGALVLAGAVLILFLASLRRWPAGVTRAFDAARHELWSDGLELWLANPVFGAGPGGFREFSDLAKDADTAKVHMSLLQVGSELGVVGLVIAVVMMISAFRLVSRARNAAAVIASAAMTLLFLHSFIDHVLEFPAVLLTVGMVVGWASEQFDVAEREHPI